MLLLSQKLHKLRKSNAKKSVIAKKSKKLRILRRKERNRAAARMTMTIMEMKNGRVARVQAN